MIEIRLNTAASARAIRVSAEAPERFKKAVDIALARAATEMKSMSQRLAPYKTGHLRRSITKRKVSKGQVVGTNVVYARIQDKGGYAGRGHKSYIPKYKGRGYFTPAFKKLQSGRLKQILEEEINAISK